MKNLTLKNVVAACGGTYFGDEALLSREVKGVVQDSRQIKEDFLFLAVKGERVDGHRFIEQVFANGALACLVEDVPENPSGPCIQVPSVLEALKMIAEFYRQTLSIPIIGITGSVGKTSTKETIASVLSQKYNTWKTQGNFNNEIGLPLTLLQIQDEHEAAVIEMGISNFGEMHRLSKMARPDYCVFTNIGFCHLEFLGTRDGILKAKTEMFDFAKEGAPVIANGDDNKLITLRETHQPVPTFFGMNSSLDCYAENIRELGLDGIACDINYNGETISVKIPIPGTHMVYNAMAGTCVGFALGLTAAEIKAGLESLKAVAGRGQILHAGSLSIMDDCYNANPASMEAALHTLSHALGRKVAILGDMGELGKDERALHKRVGRAVVKEGIDCLLLAGELSAEIKAGVEETLAGNISESPRSDVEIHYFATREELMEALPDLIKADDSILVKASHFMNFPEVIKKLQSLDR